MARKNNGCFSAFAVNIKTLLHDSTELAKRRQSGNKQMELALNLKFLNKRIKRK